MTDMVRRFLSSVLTNVKRSYTPPLVLTLISIALLTVSALICLNALGPHGDPKPSVTDWISTVGTALGAFLTGGALVIAAISFYRQAKDQHRAQASTVTVTVSKNGGLFNDHVVKASLAGDLPIYNVELVSLDHQGRQVDRRVKHVVVRDTGDGYLDGDLALHEAYVTFTDSAGTRWTRWSKGKLIELGPEPKDFQIAETPESSHMERHQQLREKLEQEARQHRQEAAQQRQFKQMAMLGDDYNMDE